MFTLITLFWTFILLIKGYIRLLFELVMKCSLISSYIYMHYKAIFSSFSVFYYLQGWHFKKNFVFWWNKSSHLICYFMGRMLRSWVENLLISVFKNSYHQVIYKVKVFCLLNLHLNEDQCCNTWLKEGLWCPYVKPVVFSHFLWQLLKTIQ